MADDSGFPFSLCVFAVCMSISEGAVVLPQFANQRDYFRGKKEIWSYQVPKDMPLQTMFS